MGAVAAFDRDGVIRLLEARGFDPDQSRGLADVLRDHVLPHLASKRGEASARGRLTTRINQAFDQIAEIAGRVARIDDRLTRVDEAMATKQDLADLRHDLLMKFGGMLVAAVGFLTVVQAFLK